MVFAREEADSLGFLSRRERNEQYHGIDVSAQLHAVIKDGRVACQ